MEAAATASSQIPDFGAPWFMSPFFEREVAERGLDPETESQVRSFAEHGYLVVDELGVEDLGHGDFDAQALIWAANLLHGGHPVADPSSTRLSQVTHYYFSDCSYTPFRSDFERGRVYFRQIVDVGTGRLQPLRSPHGRVRPPLRSRLVTWRRRVERALGRGYVRYHL